MAQKRPRSPNFPYIGLQKAVEFTVKLFEEDKMNFTNYQLALKHMGLPPTSSTSRRILSAMLEYGLLEDKNEGEDKEVRITQLAKRIVLDERPRSIEKLQNLREAVLNSDLMKKAWSVWNDKSGLPNDEAIKYKLRNDWDFTDRASDRFIQVLRDNFTYSELYNYAVLENNDQEDENLNSTEEPENNQKGMKEKMSTPPKHPNSWLEFSITLGTSKIVRLAISNKIDNDDFNFLLQWLERIKEDFIEEKENDSMDINKEMKDDDIPF